MLCKKKLPVISMIFANLIDSKCLLGLWLKCPYKHYKIFSMQESKNKFEKVSLKELFNESYKCTPMLNGT